MAASENGHSPPHYADPRDVEKFAAAQSDDALECREIGHLWRPFTAQRLPKRAGFERVLQCARCAARRIDYISLRGERLTSHMEYPEGYLAKGLGRIVGEGRDIVRLENIHRLVDRGAPVPLRRVGH